MLDILTVLLKPPNNNFSAQAELHDRLSWCEGSAASSSQPHVDCGPNPRPLKGILCPKTRSIRILIGKKSHPGDRSEHSENLQVSFPLFLFYFLYFILFLASMCWIFMASPWCHACHHSHRLPVTGGAAPVPLWCRKAVVLCSELHAHGWPGVFGCRL